MKKLLILLVAFVALASAQIDARTRAYIHAMLTDSAEVMRGTIKDTADVVRTEIDTDDNTVRGELRDTATVVWTDSVTAVRGEYRDTATVVWTDSIAVARGEFYDSAVVAVTDSAIIKSGLKADWAAGDYMIGGLQELEADTVTGTVSLESPKWLCGVDGVIGTGTIAARKLVIPSFEDGTTSCLIDSFKLNGASDTLFFFIGGSKFAAKKP